MSERRRVYRDSDGITRVLIWDDEDPDSFVVHTAQDIEQILDGVARDRETMRHGDNKKLATLPAIIYEDLKQRGIADDDDAFRKWLNSPEASPWRIWQGEV